MTRGVPNGPDNRLMKRRKHRVGLEVDVFTAAVERMKWVYQNFPTVVVSFSGGKDSTCCLEVARIAARDLGRLPVHVAFTDEELIYPETEELAEMYRHDPEIDFHWMCVPGWYRNASSKEFPDWCPWDMNVQHLWVRQPPPWAEWPEGMETPSLNMRNGGSGGWDTMHPSQRGTYRTFQDYEGPRCQIIGIRTAESLTRVSGARSMMSFMTGGNRWGWSGAWPIYDWSDWDVWWFIKEFQLPYNKAYEKLYRAGIPRKRLRIGVPTNAEAVSSAALVLKNHWPDYWERLKARIPGIDSTAKHGLSNRLMGAYLKPGETWEQAAYRYLNDPRNASDRDMLADTLRRKLNWHNGHSTLPLAGEDKCPVCGLCWRRIAHVFATGDRHNRRL